MIRPINNEERIKRVYWKNFDSRRWGYLNYATNEFRAALTNQVEPILNESKLEKIDADSISEEPLKEGFRRVYMRVARNFGNEVYDDLRSKVKKKAFEVPPDWDKVVADWLEVNTTDLIVNITSYTKLRIEDAVQKSLAEGLSIDEFQKLIKDDYAISNARARVIGRTEVIRASNFGSLEGAKGVGIPMRKEWLSTPDSRTRADHSSANGQKADSLDGFFLVGGEQLEFPGDPRGSAGNTIMCRCTTLYKPYADNQRQQVQSVQQQAKVPTNKKEAVDLIEGINDNITADIPSTANFETVLDHYKAILWANKKAGGLKTRFKYEYTTKSSSAKGGQFGYFDPNRIKINGKDFAPERIRMISWKDRDKYKDSLQKAGNRGWFAPEGNSIDSVMAHEMGHYFDIIGDLKKVGLLRGKLDDRYLAVPKGYNSRIINYRGSKSVLEEAYGQLGFSPDMRREIANLRFENAKIFGKYSMENDAEFIAMAFQYEYDYPGKNKLAGIITDLIFKRYNEAFK